MKFNILICIPIFIVYFQTNLLGLEINHYEPELIKEMGWGRSDPEDIGYGSLPSGPTTFAISQDNYIYICDTWRYRIAIFDMDLNFIKELKKTKQFESYIYLADSIKINNNFIYLVRSDGKIVALNKGGEKNYELKGNKWGKIPWIDNYFPFNGYVFYYSRNNEIKAIDPAGEIIDEITAKEKLINIEGWHEGFSYHNETQKKLIENYLNENNLIFIDGDLYHGNFNIHKKYFDFIRMSITQINDEKEKSINMNSLDPFELIGFDNDHNEYWIAWNNLNVRESKAVISIISNNGVLLDCINLPNTVNVAVAPSGDIYGMKVDDGCIFYKIYRRWGLDQKVNANKTIANISSKALSITATSFIDWKGMYTPKVVFDGNLKTGWLEKADGPGIGESITLKLDKPVTADEIKVAPGYFDPKYWVSNNRVKKLKVDCGEKPFALEFNDTQTVQKAALPVEVTFSEITFTIMEVYPSNKDNDTGISEIEFYHKGGKVEIDVSGVK